MLENYTEIIKTFIAQFGLFAPIVFMIIYSLITVVGIPASALTILAAVIFGNIKGYIIVVIGASIADAIAFFTARYFKDKVDFDNKIQKSKTTKKLFDKLNKGAEKNAFFAICLLRLSFMPYIPVSYAAGLVKNIRPIDSILATFVTNLLGSAVFIFLGGSIGDSWYIFVSAIVLLVLFLQLPKLLKKLNLIE